MTTPQQALAAYKKSKPTITTTYILKNYLLLLNSIGACITRDYKRFKKRMKCKEVFALGYFEDIFSHKIYYLEGTKGSESLTMIELEKDGSRYDLLNIVVNRENAKSVAVEVFVTRLKDMIKSLAVIQTRIE